jgi:hypothetical protein
VSSLFVVCCLIACSCSHFSALLFVCLLVSCRVRITALIDATYALWTICKYYLIQPVKAVIGNKSGAGSSHSTHTLPSPGGGRASGGHGARSAPSLKLDMQLIAPNRGGKLTLLPPPHPTTGYEGWQIEQYVSVISASVLRCCH